MWAAQRRYSLSRYAGGGQGWGLPRVCHQRRPPPQPCPGVPGEGEKRGKPSTCNCPAGNAAPAWRRFTFRRTCLTLRRAMPTGLPFNTLIAARDAVASRSVSSAELTRHVLDRIERLDTQLHAL